MTQETELRAFKEQPRGFLKFFFKVPLFLHRIGLVSWIEKFSGAQWMLITTTGRKTGKPRRVMVDVIDYDKAADTYYVEAAYGERADWVRNIRANPVFRGQVGRRKFAARAERLSPDEAADKMVAYFRRVPAYAKLVMTLGGIKVEGEVEIRQLARQMLMLAIKPVE